MGISIYYRAKVRTADADRARDWVRRWREAVEGLPFDGVTPVLEYRPPDGRHVFDNGDAAGLPWQPGDVYVNHRGGDGRAGLVRVPPLHVVCFFATAAGSESALFGLASHPPVVVRRANVVTVDDDGIETTHVEAGELAEVATGLRGWYSWWGACKTQYAGNPTLGGAANFVRAHTAVYAAVDAARPLGIATTIRDDVGFQRDRDTARLTAELARWDALIAGFTGRVSDAVGAGAVVAPIKDRPDFEHLEARGAAALAERKREG